MEKPHNNIYTKKELFVMFDRIKELIQDKQGEYFIHIRTKLEDIDVQTAPNICNYLEFLKKMLAPMPDMAGISFEFIMRPYDKNVYELQSKITKEILDAKDAPQENNNSLTTRAESGQTSDELYREDKNGKEGDSSKA